MSEKIVNIASASDAPALTKLERYIVSPPENSRVFKITPEMAERLLERNTENRPKKPGKVQEYADDMASGRWGLTGDTLKFGASCVLRDGQNRLMACIRSGVPFTTHIVFGIDDALFEVMDRGRNRSGADVLSIAGYSNTTNLAGAVRWVYLIDENKAKLRVSLEPKDTLFLLTKRYTGLDAFIPVASRIYSNTGQPVGMCAAMLYLFHRANPNAAAEFSSAWESGVYTGRFAPIGKMQKRIALMMSASSGRIHDVVRAALIITAWNVFRDGRTGTQRDFDWTPGDQFPEVAQ